MRVVCVSAHQPSAEAIAGLVAAVLPAASVEVADLTSVSGAPQCDLLVVDATSDPSRATELLMVLRARGAGVPAIAIVASSDGLASEALRRDGDAVVIPASDLSRALPNAVETAMHLERAALDSPMLAELLAGVRGTRRLIAAGRIARRVRHDINNPLAALLAEAQLMELEPLPPEQLEAVRRIVELCRRVVGLAGVLDGPPPDSAI